jgi:hypothetical protein
MSFHETTRFWEAPGAADGAEEGEQQRDKSLFLKSEFFRRPLPPEAVAALLENLTEGRLPGQSQELDFTPWGGAYNRTREDATAFVHRRELFSLKHTAIVDSDSSKAAKDAAPRWLRQSWQTARPWGSGRVFPNFPTQTSTTGGTPTTARTTSGCCESREPTIRMTSFAPTSRFRAGSIDAVDHRANLQRRRSWRRRCLRATPEEQAAPPP